MSKKPSRFVVVDFETANAQRLSACSIGVAVIENGSITDSFTSLIKPPEEVGDFAPLNIKIHGITKDMIAEAPTFELLYPQLQELSTGASILGYSKFDKSVLSNLADYYALPVHWSKIDEYIDVCAMAKKKLPQLKNHKLKTLAKYFDLGEFHHHDATDDAVICARIYLALTCGIIKTDKAVSCKKLKCTTHLNVPKAKPTPNQYPAGLRCKVDATPRQPSQAEISEAFGNFADSILEDGVVDYKEAVELRSFLSAIPQTVGVHELSLTIDDFLADDELDTDESLALCELIRNTYTELTGLPYVRCSECNAPIRTESLSRLTSCPWCDTPLPLH